ncbi:MAG: DUF805 domain-containing protein [Verrucomicrobiaceae bacterium]|nr:MAG: DUF805 domain-containing protein [Verrucomicrobiaceae bacterium]
MNIFEVLFGSQGRLGRMAFVGYSIVNLAVMVALTLAAANLWQSGAGPHALLGVLIAIAALFGALWSGLALTIKRLHDMGFSGLHVIWILPLEVASKGMGPAMDSPTLATLLSVITAAIGLGLLLVPGEDRDNRYGPV